MKRKAFFLTAITGIFLLPIQSYAEGGEFYLKPTIGLSSLSDQTPTTRGIGTVDGSSDLSLDGGFVGGLAWGYRYSNNFAAEIAWEYRSNDSQVTLADGSVFEDGNYASNTFFLNGYYFPETERTWQPYVGLGIGFFEEIDVDLESGGVEQSFSGDGETLIQFMVGVEYPVSPKLDLTAELRYSSASDISLSGEGSSGQFDGLDYDPLTIQLGLKYTF